MVAESCFYHSEHMHGEKHGWKDYTRTLLNSECGSQCEVHCCSDPWTYVTCPAATEWCVDHDDYDWVAHNDAIVIATDGACRDNGRPYARSGIGVFFHEYSDLNYAGMVDLETPYGHTSQRAELLAAIKALEIAAWIRRENPAGGAFRLGKPPGPLRRLRRVVLKADSRYLVDAMTDWIFKWRDNDYTNSRGEPVVNEDLFERLEEAVVTLNNMDVDVQFWHVSRDHNGIADWLANAGVDNQDVDASVAVYFRSLREGS